MEIFDFKVGTTWTVFFFSKLLHPGVRVCVCVDVTNVSPHPFHPAHKKIPKKCKIWAPDPWGAAIIASHTPDNT